MPRAAWLAVGAAGGTLAAAAISASAVALAAAALLAATSVPAIRRRDRGFRCVAAALGVLVIALRVLAAGPAAPPRPVPAGDGRWPGVVESVGSTRDATRPAVVRLEIGSGLRV